MSFNSALYSQAISRLEVNAGSINRHNSIVGIDLDQITSEQSINLKLYEVSKTGKSEVDFQISQDAIGRRMWWVLKGETKAGTKKTFELVKSATVNSDKRAINVSINDSTLIIYQKEEPVLQYFHATKLPPKGIDSAFKRSGFIHPLWSPSGAVLTNIQPADHYHHYGIWNPWTRVLFEGEVIDFWNLREKQGTVRFNGFAGIYSGNVFGGFKALHQHVVLSNPEKVAINEEIDTRVFNQSGGKDKVWLWDFTSTLSCASSSPVVLQEYRYGGFGFRATPEWTNKNSIVLTSEKKDRNQSDGSNARWVFVIGETGSGKSGILFMGYPTNYNYPEPLRIWPEDANDKRGDLFVNFSPTKNKDWNLEPGNQYVLKYRVLVFDGDISAETAEAYWQDFVNPPTVRAIK